MQGEHARRWSLVVAVATSGCGGRGDDTGGRGSGGSGAGSSGGASEETSSGSSEASSEAGDGATSSTGASGSTSTTTTSTTSGAGETDPGDTAGSRFDVGAPPDPGGSDEDEGCQKVDFLFVVDNTNSMSDEQSALIASMPGFITAIRDTLKISDFQIMVIDSDAGSIGTTPCDTMLGAGRVTDAIGTACGIAGGKRYMLPSQPDLDGTFACVGNQGTNGDNNERVAQAIGEGLNLLNQAGQCNEGFVRDDALLVVTIITDEEEDPNDGDGGGTPDVNSPGQPADWYQTVVAAKRGDETRAVVLGLVGDTDLPGATCQPRNGTVGAEPAPRLRSFIEMFTYGGWSPVCTGSYDAFFLDSVDDLIVGACEGFQPPS